VTVSFIGELGRSPDAAIEGIPYPVRKDRLSFARRYSNEEQVAGTSGLVDELVHFRGDGVSILEIESTQIPTA